MANIFNISQSVPLKPYIQAFPLNTSQVTSYNVFDYRYNTHTIDEDFYFNNISDYLQKAIYFQPYQNSDTISLQWLGLEKSTPYVDYYMYLIDCNGVIVKTVSTSCNTLSPVYGGQYIWESELKLNTVKEGRYFVQIKCFQFGKPDTYLIFEPIEVKKYHKNTNLIEYWNSKNDFGIYVEDSNIKSFQKRIKAKFVELLPNSKFFVYEDQTMNVEMLGGVKYREYSLQFQLIPKWEYDKLESIMLYDSIKVDGLDITRAEGSKIEPIGNNFNELFNAKINVRERFNKDSLVCDDNFTFKVATLPQDKAFSVQSITLGTTTVDIHSYFTSKQDLINLLNNYFANEFSFSLVGNDLYTKGLTSGNSADLLANGSQLNNLWYNYLQMHYISESGTNDFSIQLNSNANIKYAFFPNDGGSNISDYTGSNTTETISYTANDGEYTAYLFYNSVTEIILDSNQTKIIGLGGNVGNITLFSTVYTFVQYFIDNLFKNSSTITTLYFQGNYLNSLNLNKLFIFLYDAKVGSNGEIDITLQQPNATTITNDSGVQKFYNELLNKNWTIYLD